MFPSVVYSLASVSSAASRRKQNKLHCRRLASSIVIHSEVLSVVPPTYLDRFNMIPNHQNVPLASAGFRSINIIARKLATNLLFKRYQVSCAQIPEVVDCFPYISVYIYIYICTHMCSWENLLKQYLMKVFIKQIQRF